MTITLPVAPLTRNQNRRKILKLPDIFTINLLGIKFMAAIEGEVTVWVWLEEGFLEKSVGPVNWTVVTQWQTLDRESTGLLVLSVRRLWEVSPLAWKSVGKNAKKNDTKVGSLELLFSVRTLHNDRQHIESICLLICLFASLDYEHACRRYTMTDSRQSNGLLGHCLYWCCLSISGPLRSTCDDATQWHRPA